MNYNTDLNIRNVVEDSLFYGGDTEVRRKAIVRSETGIDNLTRCVEEILGGGISKLCVTLKDVAGFIQVDLRDLKKSITEAQRNAKVAYDGYYSLPEINDPEKVVYGMVVNTIYEIGRVSKDIDEYVVLTSMDSIFSVIETPSDMLAFGWFIDWAVFSLRHDKWIPLTAFLKENHEIGKLTLYTFIRKQPWYDFEDESQELLGVPARSSVKDIGRAIRDLLSDFKSHVCETEGDRVYSIVVGKSNDCNLSLADEIDDSDDISSLFDLPDDNTETDDFPDDDTEEDSPIGSIFSASDEEDTDVEDLTKFYS